MASQLYQLCQIPRLHLAWDTVKAKGSAGGIDGMTIIEFEHDKRKEISKLAEELEAGTWKPQPYMEIEVAKTKNPDEMRELGMTAIRDKIVQHAIKSGRHFWPPTSILSTASSMPIMKGSLHWSMM